MGSKMTKAEVAARRREALRLRLGGASLVQIGERLGISESRACRVVNDALRQTVQEPADQIRQLEAARLDQLQVAMWPKAMQGSGWAVDRCLGIMKRRAELLALDAQPRLAGTDGARSMIGALAQGLQVAYEQLEPEGAATES
jgi:hypothetical protein